MRKISLILAILMIISSMFVFASCGNDTEKEGGEKTEDKAKTIAPEDAVVSDMVAAIENEAPYAEYVSEVLYMKDDPDEMVKWTYGVVDLNANELLCDYAITMPSDYSHTLAVLKFEDGMTDADFEEVKEAITNEYLRSRASALQMYMPDEYADIEWAIENTDKVWRQYGDSVLVLAVYGGEEPTAVWDAIDSYLAGETAE